MARLSDLVGQAVLDDFLENSPDVLAGKLDLANEVVEYARSISPVDSGDYQSGIKVRRYGRNGVGVVFSDPKSSLIEFGTEDTPEFAVRRRTIEHFQGPLA